MQATEAHFRSLADSLAQPVWVVDGAGRLVYGNLAWQSLTRIHVGASFVESYVPALHPVDRTSWEQTWEQAVNSGEPYALERRVRFLPQASYVRQLEWGKPLLENGSRTGVHRSRWLDRHFSWDRVRLGAGPGARYRRRNCG